MVRLKPQTGVLTTAVIITAVCSGGLQPARAQTQAGPPLSPASAASTLAADDLANEIVVTAQKRAESVQAVPVSIAAFSGATLAKANVTSVQDLGRIATNFSTTRGSSAASIRLNVRGIGAIGNSAIEPSVGVYLDGVYVPRAGSILGSFLDIQVAEVLRGPQGTLFGRNASAGALSLSSALPTATLSGRITGEVGNASRQRLDGFVNVPLGEGVAVRVAALGQWFDGFWINQLDGKRYGRSDDFAGRASLKAERGAFTWVLTGDYAQSRGDGFANYDFDADTVSAVQLASLRLRLGGLLPDTNLDDNVFNQAVAADLRDSHWGTASRLSADLGFGTIRLINSYRDWQSEQLDGDVTFLPVPILSRQSDFRSRSQNHELQFISPEREWLGGRLDLVAGLYRYHERYAIVELLNQRAEFCNVLIPAGPGRAACAANLAATGGLRATDQDVRQTTASLAAYGQANVHITDSLTAVVGGRWTQDKKSGRYSQKLNTPFAAALRAAEVLTFPNLTESQFTYRLGLNYKPSDQVLLYASYLTGFKSGGYNSGGGTPALSTFDANGNLLSTQRLFGRETVSDYEAGLKSTWSSGVFLFNINLYRMDFNGYQDRSFDGVSFNLRNAGSLRQQGVEVDTIVRPTRRFSVSAAFAYLDSAFTDFRNAAGLPGLGGVQDLTGKPATFSPRFSGNIGADWQGDFGQGGLSWALNANLSFVSDQFNGSITDANPQSVQDGYMLLGGRVTLNSADDRWSASLFGTNLTNTQYANLSVIQVLDGPLGLRNGVFPGSSAIRQVHANPRTYGASATFRF